MEFKNNLDFLKTKFLFKGLAPGVNFTKLCSPSKKLPVHSLQEKIRRSVSPIMFHFETVLNFDKHWLPFAQFVHLKNLFTLVNEIDPWSTIIGYFERIKKPVGVQNLLCTSCDTSRCSCACTPPRHRTPSPPPWSPLNYRSRKCQVSFKIDINEK